MFLFDSARISPFRFAPIAFLFAFAVVVLSIVLGGTRAVAQDSSLASIEALIKQSKLGDAAMQLEALLLKQPNNTHALSLLGDVRVKQNNWVEAESLYRHAVASNPKSLEACSNLASLLRDEARWPEATAQYESCRKLAPGNAKIAVELATAYEKSGEFTRSLTVATTIPAASRPAQLLPVIASNYLAANQSVKAQQAIGDVLKRAPDDPRIVPNLASSLLDHGMVTDAAELLRVAQPRQTVTAEFLATVAKVQAANGETQQARITLDRAVKMQPKSQDVLATGAALAIRWLQWDKALEFLDAAMAAGPPRSDLLQSIVFVELRKQDLQSAHDIAQRWYTLRPGETAAALALAIVLVEGNHWGEAKPLLEKVLATSPNDKGALLAMGVVQYNAGEVAASKKSLTAALGAGAPDDANAHYFLGLIAKQEGNLPGAIQEFERSVSIQTNNPRAFGQLGQLYLQQNDLTRARAALEKAIEQSPDEPQNHYELARVYNKLGMKEQSEQQLALYQKLRPQRPTVPPGEANPKHN